MLCNFEFCPYLIIRGGVTPRKLLIWNFDYSQYTLNVCDQIWGVRPHKLDNIYSDKKMLSAVVTESDTYISCRLKMLSIRTKKLISYRLKLKVFDNSM